MSLPGGRTYPSFSKWGTMSSRGPWYTMRPVSTCTKTGDESGVLLMLAKMRLSTALGIFRVHGFGSREWKDDLLYELPKRKERFPFSRARTRMTSSKRSYVSGGGCSSATRMVARKKRVAERSDLVMSKVAAESRPVEISSRKSS
eukprot:6186256-Pleurochrysis_carterae.AAC.1